MTAVFLKSDCEPDSEIANIETKVAYFLSVLSPTTKIDTVAQPGDDVINITRLNRHTGAAGYHVLLNGVPTGFVYPDATRPIWGEYRPAVRGRDITATILGKRIVIRKGQIRSLERFTPGVITTICHEIAEMLADGDIATYTKPDWHGNQWLLEPADWVDGTYFTRTINGNLCVFPNVALPAFSDTTNKVGPYDIMGLVKAPFQPIMPHAYAYAKDPKTGGLVKIY